MGFLEKALDYKRKVDSPSFTGIEFASISGDSDTDVEDYERATSPSARLRRLRTSKISIFARYAGLVLLSVCISSLASVYFIRAFLANPQLHNDNTLNAITNSTLGFDKIYSISLPRHWHKHDAQLLAARYTGLDITPVEGVLYDDIPRTEYPLGWHDPFPGSIGCWRAHLNVLAEIVASGVGSALILEDDADWDVSLKPQLQEFARGALAIQSTTTKTSPYGDDWDLLQIGGCQFNQPNHDHRYYLIEDDITVPPLSHRHSNFEGPEEILEMNNTRAVFKYGYGTCTTGYAVTQDAARRMLAAISLPPNVVESAIDRKYGRMCAHFPDELPLNCVAVYPPLIGMHRFAGSAKADSDIMTEDDAREDQNVHPEYTFDVVYSATMNVLPFALGAKSAAAQQFPGEEPREDIERKGRSWDWKGSVVELEPRET
jgi:hypothetical protein